jgi:cobalt/nickel transport system permease protein
VIEEPFSRGESFLHALDPRAKLIAVTAFSLATAISASLPGPLLGLCLAVVLTALARLDAKALIKRVLAVNLFILFLWLVLPFTVPGESFFSLGFLSASREGVALALLVTVKSNAILLAFIALTATSDAPAIGQALRRLRVPDKLSFLFLFTYRYIHVIAREYELLATTAKLRGFVPRTSMHTYRTYANLLAMTLIKSFDQSRRVYEAMLLRGFHGKFYSLREFRMTPRDAVFLAFMIGASAFLALAGMPQGVFYG